MTQAAAMLDESEILSAMADGDTERAIRLLMHHYGKEIYSYCRRILRDRALADDVHQETFEHAFRDLQTWERRSSCRSWLFGIANHRCLDAIKSRKRRERYFVSPDDDFEVASPDIDPGSQPENRARLAALDACLSRLKPAARMLVLLRFQEELSYEEMGRMLREKPDTLRARVVRAMPALRMCLESKGIEL